MHPMLPRPPTNLDPCRTWARMQTLALVLLICWTARSRETLLQTCLDFSEKPPIVTMTAMMMNLLKKAKLKRFNLRPLCTWEDLGASIVCVSDGIGWVSLQCFADFCRDFIFSL